MDVSDVMTREVRTCTAEDGLQIAAQLMWALGCGGPISLRKRWCASIMQLTWGKCR